MSTPPHDPSSTKSAPRQRPTLAEMRELRDRLAEAEETIEALRTGAVDAVVVHGESGHQVYSLAGADQPYRVYVERMQEGAVTVSQDGLILFCNQRFAAMTGAPLEQVIGSSILGYLAPEVWSHLGEVFASPEVVAKHKGELQGASGAPLPVLLTASELPLVGHTVMCLVVTDLSAQEETARLLLAKEVAERSNVAKDHFFAILSHELRTPLTPVLMTITALQEESHLPPPLREHLHMMKRNIELETRLIDDLLDLNRMATGKLKLRTAPVDLNEAVTRVCDICRPAAVEQGVTLELKLSATAVPVTADAARLQQVLWNLMKNAIKFTPPGGRVELATSLHPSGWSEVRLTDSGIGIAPDALPRIFDAFEQGNDGITRQFGGLGLGLAISKALMLLHGGEITAHSDGLGHGASFTIRLRTDSRPRQEAVPRDEPLVPRPGLRLLVVEDHDDTLATLKRLLTRLGYVVRTAGSISGALRLARDFEFDVLISDIGLPDGRGTELLAHMEACCGRTLPSIAMSGFGMDDDLERSRHAGFTVHLTKPVDFTVLHRAILRLAPHSPAP